MACALNSPRPKGTQLRASAAAVNRAVVNDRQELDAALSPALAAVAERDRALLKAMAFGMLRWHHRLDWQFRNLIGRHKARRDPMVAALVRCGLFQIQFLRIPDHAAVAATAEAGRRCGRHRQVALINALLRRYLREAQDMVPPPEQAVAHFSHPAWLIDALQQDWPDRWREVLAANNEQPPMWLRVNTSRGTTRAYLEALNEVGLSAQPVAEAGPAALLLDEPAPVESLPGFNAGAVSVQDGAAQLACRFLDLQPGLRVLDACAAPGGKTAHMLEQYPGLAVLALDRSPTRVELMAAGLARLGLAAELRVADAGDPATWWDGRAFDRILLDAPCTATGVIRRHPDIKVLRQADDVDRARAGQLRLLGRLWSVLAPGGRLVYATCSVLRAENQRVVADFLEQTTDAVVAPGAAPSGRQIFPGEAKMDGFYYACLLKGR